MGWKINRLKRKEISADLPAVKFSYVPVHGGTVPARKKRVPGFHHGNRARPALTRQCTQMHLLALRGERTFLQAFARSPGPKFYSNFTRL